jgi:hypothetical protein
MLQQQSFFIVTAFLVFLSGCGNGPEIVSRLKSDDLEGLFAQVVSSDAGKVRLMAAAPKNYDTMWFCPGDVECKTGSGKALISGIVSSDRAFFEFPEAITVGAGTTITMVAVNSKVSTASKARVIRVVPVPVNDGQASFQWQQQVNLVSIPAMNRPCDETRFKRFYCEVMRYTRSPYLSSGDPATDVHETQHFMLHEQARTGSKFIYWQDGKGVYFPEPKTLTGDIVDKIIFKQGIYFKTYIGSRPSQTLGENIMDEWRAYLTEEIYGIEVGNSTGMGAGGVEFLYYNAAMLTALAEREPNYFANKSGVAAFAMLAEIAHDWSITRGVEKNFFSGPANQRAQKILELMRNDPDHSSMRETLKNIYGASWTKKVLGF